MAYTCPIYPSKLCCEETDFFPRRNAGSGACVLEISNYYSSLEMEKKEECHLTSLRISVFVTSHDKNTWGKPSWDGGGTILDQSLGMHPTLVGKAW